MRDSRGRRRKSSEGSRPRARPLPVTSKKAVAPDVEKVALIGDGPADSADIVLILLDHGHAMAGLGETVGGRQPGGTAPIIKVSVVSNVLSVLDFQNGREQL